jgi:hypothetical protein
MPLAVLSSARVFVVVIGASDRSPLHRRQPGLLAHRVDHGAVRLNGLLQ